MSSARNLELPIDGMTCEDCAQIVRRAIAQVEGVRAVEVSVVGAKAFIDLTPGTDRDAIRRSVEGAGYRVVQPGTAQVEATARFNRSILLGLGAAVAIVVLAVVLGEQFGLIERVTDLVPVPIALGLVLVVAYPVLRGVVLDLLKGRVTSATLMSVGLVAALVVGQWTAAILVVFFIRLGEYIEAFTTERSRLALKSLTALSPQTARVERDGSEAVVAVANVRPSEIVVVRPGEQIPVDGEVVSGHATIDQAAITGESMPADVAVGGSVFAASFARLGSVRVRVRHVGADTTFGRVIRLVEEAETHRGPIQQMADRFSAHYLPVVGAIAVLTFLVRRDPLATAAVLVVACSCAFALATPIAILASVGAGAKRGLLIKGGKFLEELARADVVLLDKTGTLTFGRPEVTDIVAEPRVGESELLAVTAAAERYSEHPLAEAVRGAARAHGIAIADPESFDALAGVGVRALVGGREIAVGGPRLLGERELPPSALALAATGKTLLVVLRDGSFIGVLAASDTLRPEVPAALRALRDAGIKHIELLTGDSALVAAPLAARLGVACESGLLPDDKIAIVRRYQAEGHTVVMIGDGINDAPALSQANVGIAMGVGGSGVAIDAAHIALMREDWALVPEVFAIARRTIGVVRLNIGFTAVYNLVGLALAALGFLPPALAAAAQSLPDLIMLANSARLLAPPRSESASADDGRRIDHSEFA